MNDKPKLPKRDPATQFIFANFSKVQQRLIETEIEEGLGRRLTVEEFNDVIGVKSKITVKPSSKLQETMDVAAAQRKTKRHNP